MALCRGRTGVAYNKYSPEFVLLSTYYTPCPEKNGTNNVLGITLTKFNKFPQFLAQFMLTCQLTKKL